MVGKYKLKFKKWLEFEGKLINKGGKISEMPENFKK